MKRAIISLFAVLSVVPSAHAANSTIDMDVFSGPFADLVSDLGAALSYKAVAPAEPLGITGFDIGLEISATKMETGALDSATGGDAPSTLYVPKVHLHKGLPFGIDVGAFYTNIPSSNIGVFGAEVRYAILKGSTITPALAIRGTYSKLSGVDNFGLTTMGLELTISKGFVMFTPYAGIGRIQMDGKTSIPGISDESVSENKYFIGLNFNLGLMNFAAETEQTGENSTTSAKFGFRF